MRTRMRQGNVTAHIIHGAIFQSEIFLLCVCAHHSHFALFFLVLFLPHPTVRRPPPPPPAQHALINGQMHLTSSVAVLSANVGNILTPLQLHQCTELHAGFLQVLLHVFQVRAMGRACSGWALSES